MSHTHHHHHHHHHLLHPLLLILLLLSLFFSSSFSTPTQPTPQQLQQGFSATPLSTTTTSFQPLLTDPTSNFSFGFLRHNNNPNLLSLATLHLPSSQPFWLANPTNPASWSHTTLLSFFNGTLLLSDTSTNHLYWSTSTHGGDTLLLLNTSNLIITHNNNPTSPLWQSFHFPSNTLVQDQNFTSTMSLRYYHLPYSSKPLYSFRLVKDFMGLFASYGNRELLYWKRTPLEAKAEIKEGEGPIYARVNTDGYFGMYQASSIPVDVQKFNTFQQTTSFLIVRLEADGNLRGYYWDGNNWVLNYEAITETCDLPNPCGSYGLCTPGIGCSCLDNRTRFELDGCFSDSDNNNYKDNFCAQGIIDRKSNNNYFVIRRSGVEPPHKELIGFVTTSSLAECEAWCEKKCNCWGALYSNSTGFCYVLDYPVQTMVGTGDGSKVGYFKVRKEEEGKNRVRIQVGVMIAVLVGVSVVVGVGIWIMRWRRRKGVNAIMKEDNGASPGPYKNLESASFRSIEMCNSL